MSSGTQKDETVEFIEHDRAFDLALGEPLMVRERFADAVAVAQYHVKSTFRRRERKASSINPNEASVAEIAELNDMAEAFADGSLAMTAPLSRGEAIRTLRSVSNPVREGILSKARRVTAA